MTHSSSSGKEVSTVTLRALEGTPLQHESIRNMVLATTEAIAERQGVRVDAITADDSSVTVRILGEQIVALGLAAELRRLTTNWYKHKFGVDTLWGDLEPGA